MKTPVFSVLRTTQTTSEADLLIAAMRIAGLHPLDLDTTSHYSFAGLNISYPVEIPTEELDVAREFLRSYDSSAYVAQEPSC